jgi:type IV secretory pathway VirB6-like protein
MLSPSFWIAVLRVWVGLYWIWNGIDDLRGRKNVATKLAKGSSTSRFLWYRRWISGYFEAHASAFALFIPFTTLFSGLLIVLGILIVVAMIYLIFYCLNLYALGLISVKSLTVQVAPLLIIGLSGSNQTLPWFLFIFP